MEIEKINFFLHKLVGNLLLTNNFLDDVTKFLRPREQSFTKSLNENISYFRDKSKLLIQDLQNISITRFPIDEIEYKIDVIAEINFEKYHINEGIHKSIILAAEPFFNELAQEFDLQSCKEIHDVVIHMCKIILYEKIHELVNENTEMIEKAMELRNTLIDRSQF